MSLGGRRKSTEPSELIAGTITAISPKGAKGERVVVYVDGRRAFDLSATCAADARLRIDEFLTEERQAQLMREDEPERARETALRVLARREATSREVSDKLEAAGFSQNVVGDTLAWSVERGFVDDRRFAAAYVAARSRAGCGRQRIVSELLRKGIPRDLLVGDAWSGLAEDISLVEQMEHLVALVGRRFAGQLRSDPEGAKRRIGAFLARRGHEWDTISAVIKALGDVGREDADV